MRRRRWLVVGALALAAAALAIAWPHPAAEEAAPVASFAMRGTVTTVSGLPLAGAQVALFAIDEAHAFTPLGHAVARPDGSYALAFAPPAGAAGLVLVRASAPGCASESRSVELDARAQDFRLAEQAARVVVHVEDDAGVARAGADVLLTFEPVAAASDALYAWRQVADATGAATFDGLPVIAGTLHVVAEHAHARVFAAHAKPAGAIRTELTARLARGRAVHGQLVAAAASALTGAEVVLREVDGPWLARITARADGSFDVPDAPIETPLVAEVTGDWVLAGDATVELAFQRAAEGGIPHRVVVQPTPDGELVVDALEAGTYRVVAHSAAHGYSGAAEVTLVEGNTAQVALQFAGTARLEGKVVASGGPLGSARIDVRRAASFERAPDDFTGNWAAAADDGTFAVGGLSPGRWTVKITSDATAPVIRTLDLGDGTTRATFTADPGAALEVALRSTVRTTAGRVVLLESRDLPGLTARVVADPQGHARFAHLPAGHYDVRALVDGMPTASVDLAARADRRVDLRLD